MQLHSILSVIYAMLLFTAVSGTTAQTNYHQPLNKNIISDTVLTGKNPEFRCGDALTDRRDNKKYRTVKLGNQCWMAENLNTGTFTRSIKPRPVHSDVSDNGKIEKYCYENDPGNCLIYGGLYDWNEMMQYSDIEGTQGICPDGWHIPSEAELFSLVKTLGGWEKAGAKLCKNGSARFDALNGGLRLSHGQFNHLETAGSYWISKAANNTAAWYYYFLLNENIFYGNLNKTDGYSVRCIKDNNTCRDLPSQAFAGPDIIDVDSNSVYLNASKPVNGKGSWSIIKGRGGRIEDTADPKTLFKGKMNHNYLLRWSVITTCGISTDEITLSFAKKETVECPETVTDADGNVYSTIRIGNQCWMAQNLNTGIFVEDERKEHPHSKASGNGIIEKYCMQNDVNNCNIYGALYDWDELMNYSHKEGIQGICPVGWHVPSVAEWDILINYAGGAEVASDFLSEEGSSGFNAIMAGYRISYGIFVHLNNRLGFATSNQFNGISQWTYYKIYNDSSYYRGAFNKKDAYSVRCLKMKNEE
jgi:uncharacterized protein (TIGR02145 family)